MNEKSLFLTDLHVELKPASDRIWRLSYPLLYWSYSLQRFVAVPIGFESDFASVPRLPIAYSLWGDRVHREAVLHDYLFRKNCMPTLSFMAANGVFLEAMDSRGVPWHIRYPMYAGVCLAGYNSYHKRCVEDTL